MERKNLIKGGGGALTRVAHTRRTIDPSVNQALTAKYKADLRFLRFLNWLGANGAVFPRVEFPVAFGPEGLVGALAKEDIGASSAFMYIPERLCISVTRAEESEVADMFIQHPYLFSGHSDSDSYRLYVFLAYERLKQGDSFYHPYFQVIQDTALLSDWNEEELRELQDPTLILEAKEERSRISGIWTELREAVSVHPAFQSNPAE
jgi:hypothetical protein